MTKSSVRALTRVAWRNIARHRGRSLLVVALVALPVAAMVAGIAILRTTEPSQARQEAALFGRADLLAQGVSEGKLRSFLPDGSNIEPTFWSDGQLLIAGARPSVTIRGIDLDGLGQSMLTLVGGRTPKGEREAAISAEVARIAGVTIGGQLTIDDAAPVTVVGLVEDGLRLNDRIVLFDPRAVNQGDPEFASWLVGLPPGADPDAFVAATYDPTTNVQQFALQSRHGGGINMVGGDMSPTILVLGTLALVEAALVASAAFAVSIRRRQRELGLLAASGATPRQLGGTVLAEAMILGLIACAVGVAAGLLFSFGTSPFLDGLTQRRNPSIIVDSAGVIGPALIGFVAAVIAAIVPARTAARVPVLLSLSGRRPPEVPARRTLRIGLVVVGISIGLTLLGANLRIDGVSGVREMLVVVGAVLGTLGFGASAPWLLERLDGLAVRLPLASRIAFRDTARARSRNSPIVTAVLASLAATITLGTAFASKDADNAKDWRPYLYADELVVRGAGADQVGRELAAGPGAVGGSGTSYLAAQTPEFFNLEVPDARDAAGSPVRWGNEHNIVPTVDNIMVATPELLSIANAADAAAPLAAGKVVVLWPEPITLDSVDFVFSNNVGDGTAERRVHLPATVITTGVTAGVLPGALISQAVATQLGLEQSDAQQFIVRLDHTVTQADVDAAAVVAGRTLDTFVDASLGPQRADASFRILLIVLALLFAVSVTGVAIALGEAESRPEQRTLLALGADPRLRRRLVASRAATLALLAGILAVPAGLLPAWGLLASLNQLFAVPVLEVAAAVLVLPFVAVVGSWLLSRPIPDWNAFRNVGTGQ
ncbi:MAG: FtsX-like permease family protein [Chloroflexi bacterium]|nr:FtsX-like permease family protein [Chloroflexota bacterium]